MHRARAAEGQRPSAARHAGGRAEGHAAPRTKQNARPGFEPRTATPKATPRRGAALSQNGYGEAQHNDSGATSDDVI